MAHASVINALLPDRSPGYYTLSDMDYRVAPMEEVLEIVPIAMPDPGDYYTNSRMYYADGGSAPSVISTLYRTVGGSGLDEIVVIADLGRGLEDYRDFKNYEKSLINGVTVSSLQRWENGEYYTDAYFNLGDIDYYVKITSPGQDSAGYIRILLESAG